MHGALFDLADRSGWEEATASAVETLEAAAALGAHCVYGLTGPGLPLTWEAAAGRVRHRGRARRRARTESRHAVSAEPTNVVFPHVVILHTFRDTVDLALDFGLGVCLDVQGCWAERGLRETLRRASSLLGLVQHSDFVPGGRALNRVAPGDGMIPLERIVAAILEDGYTGLFDVELYEEPGVDPVATLARAADRVSNLLERLDA